MITLTESTREQGAPTIGVHWYLLLIEAYSQCTSHTSQKSSISYQMNLGEFRGQFSDLISTELAMGFIDLKRDLSLIVFGYWEFSIW